MRTPFALSTALLLCLLAGACGGEPRHTVVIDSREVEGGTGYTIEVDGSLEQAADTVDGIPVTDDAGDEVSSASDGGASTAGGQVTSGADGWRVTGEITGITLDDAAGARVLVDGDRHFTEEHTVVIEGAGSGETSYTLEVTGEIEVVEDSLAGHGVGSEASDVVDGRTVTGAVAGDADGYRVRGGIVSVDVTEPSSATVYLDGRERHTVVIDGRDLPGGTDYTIEVAGRVTQVDGEVAGVGVSGGDRVDGGTATGTVGGGADGFVTSGAVTSIELGDASAARVLVDGEPHYTEEHTVLVDGEGSSEPTSYTLEAAGEIVPAGDSLDGRAAGLEADDRADGERATGTVAGDADGYRVRGGIRTIEIGDPSAATVRVDGREYHTVVIDGSGTSGSTSYTIEVDGRIVQEDDRVAGFDVSGGDRVEGGTATGRVGGGIDGFRVYGSIRSIELDDPSAAVVRVDGTTREE